MIVTKQEELTNPVIVYTIIIKWMWEAGEDFYDYNESIVDGEDILQWMVDKGYVTQQKANEIIEKGEANLGDLLFGYKTGLIEIGSGGIGTYKGYQILAEYISEHEEDRKLFIYNYCESFDEDNGDECRGFMSASYDDDDGFPICSHIEEKDLKEGTVTKEEWLKKDGNIECSFVDEYGFLKLMSFEDVNNHRT